MKNKKRKPNRKNYNVRNNIIDETKQIVPVRKTSTRQMCVVSYCTFGILGLVFFFMKKNNNYVKYNGLQSAVMNLPVLVLVTILLRYLPYTIPSLLLFVLLLFDMSAVVKCRKYEVVKYPYFGELAENIVLKKYKN